MHLYHKTLCTRLYGMAAIFLGPGPEQRYIGPREEVLRIRMVLYLHPLLPKYGALLGNNT